MVDHLQAIGERISEILYSIEEIQLPILIENGFQRISAYGRENTGNPYPHYLCIEISHEDGKTRLQRHISPTLVYFDLFMSDPDYLEELEKTIRKLVNY